MSGFWNNVTKIYGGMNGGRWVVVSTHLPSLEDIETLREHGCVSSFASEIGVVASDKFWHRDANNEGMVLYEQHMPISPLLYRKYLWFHEPSGLCYIPEPGRLVNRDYVIKSDGSKFWKSIVGIDDEDVYCQVNGDLGDYYFQGLNLRFSPGDFYSPETTETFWHRGDGDDFEVYRSKDDTHYDCADLIWFHNPTGWAMYTWCQTPVGRSSLAIRKTLKPGTPPSDSGKPQGTIANWTDTYPTSGLRVPHAGWDIWHGIKEREEEIKDEYKVFKDAIEDGRNVEFLDDYGNWTAGVWFAWNKDPSRYRIFGSPPEATVPKGNWMMTGNGGWVAPLTEHKEEKTDPYARLKEAVAEGKIVEWKLTHKIGWYTPKSGSYYSWCLPPESYRILPTKEKKKMFSKLATVAGLMKRSSIPVLAFVGLMSLAEHVPVIMSYDAIRQLDTASDTHIVFEDAGETRVWKAESDADGKLTGIWTENYETVATSGEDKNWLRRVAAFRKLGDDGEILTVDYARSWWNPRISAK